MSSDLDLRQARWLVERAQPDCRDMPQVAAALEQARQILGIAAGDYRPGEAEAFAALPPVVVPDAT